jgi:hypothetical protein
MKIQKIVLIIMIGFSCIPMTGYGMEWLKNKWHGPVEFRDIRNALNNEIDQNPSKYQNKACNMSVKNTPAAPVLHTFVSPIKCCGILLGYKCKIIDGSKFVPHNIAMNNNPTANTILRLHVNKNIHEYRRYIPKNITLLLTPIFIGVAGGYYCYRNGFMDSFLEKFLSQKNK